MSIACYDFITFPDLYSTGHDKKMFSFSFPAARRISFPEPARPSPQLQSSEAVRTQNQKLCDFFVTATRTPGIRPARFSTAVTAGSGQTNCTAAVCHDSCSFSPLSQAPLRPPILSSCRILLHCTVHFCRLNFRDAAEVDRASVLYAKKQAGTPACSVLKNRSVFLPINSFVFRRLRKFRCRNHALFCAASMLS